MYLFVYQRSLRLFVVEAIFILIVGFLASCSGESSRSDEGNGTQVQENAGASASVAGSNVIEPIALQFGIYTSDQPKVMVEQFRPILDAIQQSMTESMQRPVTISTQVFSTYEDGMGAIIDGAVDFSRFGPASYTIVKSQRPEVSLLGVEQNNGGRIFYGVICTHSDSSLKTCQDIMGKSFAFGDDKSTIGRYLSQEYLLDCGISASDLSSYEYLHRHDRVGDAVARREYDAGALKESTFRKMVESGSPLREVARFPNVTKPWVAKAGLDPEIKASLREALLEMDDEAALKALKKSGFEAGSDEDYDSIREAINRSDDFFKE